MVSTLLKDYKKLTHALMYIEQSFSVIIQPTPNKFAGHIDIIND